jgi:hypothetical protein
VGPSPTSAQPSIGADNPEAPSDCAGAVVRAAGRLRVVLGLATLAMLGLSWPLWVASPAFPRVPFVPCLDLSSESSSWALFAVLIGSIAAATAGFAWRKSLALALVVLTFLILQDQQRFQAWVYQFGMVALFLAALPEAQALALARWWYIATYAYSGLSKLDASFCHELGERFLETAVHPLGLAPEGWPPAVRCAAILAMPAWEIAVAIGLSIPSTRRLGRAGAVALHLTLLMILGPWGMAHTTVVLVWNAAMMAEVWIAFDPGPASRRSSGRFEGVSPPGWLAWVAFVVGVVLPLGERWGYCDAWPAHALYASHVARTEIFLHEDELAAFPEEVRRHARETGSGPWRRLDLTGWSRAVRGIPAYPQDRACNGLAEWLAARYGDPRLIRVVHWGRADRWTGRRTRDALLGLEEIRRQGDRYLLNAHPDQGFGQTAIAVGGREGPNRSP